MRRKTSVAKLKRPPIKNGAESDVIDSAVVDLPPTGGAAAAADVFPPNATLNVTYAIDHNEDEEYERPVAKRGRKTNPRKTTGTVSASTSSKVTKKVKLLLDNYAPSEKCDLILTCGDGDAGQLGLGGDSTSCKRPKIIQNFSPPVVSPSGFLQIVAGGMHTAVLTSDNEVYTCGCNDEGALGRECYQDDGKTIPDDDQDYTLRKVNFSTDLIQTHGRVMQISAGDTHCAALTEKGSVFIWGTFRDKGGCLGISLNDSKHDVIVKNVRPVLLSSFKERSVVKIASGFNHLALLSSEGHISTVGAGDAGQLGRLAPQFRDSSVSHRTKSTMLQAKDVGVRSRSKVFFDNLWCTGYCCYARSVDGSIYVWGLNNYFQLGYVPPDPEQMDIHQPVLSEQFKSDKKWIHFAGDHHVLALTDEGKIYVIGRGDDSRLGLGAGNQGSCQVLTELPGVENIVGIAASNSGSFAWNKDGDAFVWGYNLQGELGLGLDENEPAETPTKLNAKSLEGCKLMQISAGGQHTVFLARKMKTV